METTYEEACAHLGMQTQRNGPNLTILRTTPLLLGLCSVVTLYMQHNAEPLAIPPRRAARYPKPAATFTNAIARLHRHLWLKPIVMSAAAANMTEAIPPAMQHIIEGICYAP